MSNSQVFCSYWNILSSVQTILSRVWNVLSRVIIWRAGLGGSGDPQKALCGGIPDPYLEPLTRSWSHFVGIYCQKLTDSVSN